MILLLLVSAWAADERLVREPSDQVGPGRAPWIVRYEGGGPMDTPTFLQAVRSPAHEQAYRRLQSRDLAAGLGLATSGTLLGLSGVVLLPVAFFEEDPRLGLAGGALMLGGYGIFSLCRIPFTRHARREEQPSAFLTPEETDLLIEQAND